MSIIANRMRRLFAQSDAKRDSKYAVPEDVERATDISYGDHGKWSLLDVYRPVGVESVLPVIVSIHGGGFFYGTKEVYQYYCMDLARRGFAVVSFNYRLAPEHRFPAQLVDINDALGWVMEHAAGYRMDTGNVFLVGDSAGAQLCMSYCVLLTDAGHAALLGIRPPEDLKPRAVALNCGLYDLLRPVTMQDKWLAWNYTGLKCLTKSKKLAAYDCMNAAFPPAFVASAHHDMLLECSRDINERLDVLRTEHIFTVYGSPDDPAVAHVFHIDIATPEAKRCNDDECEFFRAHIAER